MNLARVALAEFVWLLVVMGGGGLCQFRLWQARRAL